MIIERVENRGPTRRLDASKIVEAAKNVADDVNRRMPETNLAGLADELAALAAETEERGRRARRPFLAIRNYLKTRS